MHGRRKGIESFAGLRGIERGAGEMSKINQLKIRRDKSHNGFC